MDKAFDNIQIDRTNQVHTVTVDMGPARPTATGMIFFCCPHRGGVQRIPLMFLQNIHIYDNNNQLCKKCDQNTTRKNKETRALGAGWVPPTPRL